MGAIGTAVAQQNLRSILSFCNSPQMNAIEAYIHFKPDLISVSAGGNDIIRPGTDADEVLVRFGPVGGEVPPRRRRLDGGHGPILP